MKIYGRSGSSNSFKVFWIADELGLSYERIDTGGAFGGNKSAEYLSLNPNGKVPTLIEDGVAIWESNAIVRYLAARYGAGSFWAADPLERTMADRWMDWCSLAFGKVVLDARKAILSGVPVAQALAPAMPSANILERQLGMADYVAGDAIGMADIPIGPWAHRFCELGASQDDHPSIFRYRDRLLARPAFVRHLDGL